MHSQSTVHEERRLDVLRSYGVLDSAPEEAFDNITRLAAEMCSMPIALVSLVDEARQWFKAKVGLEVSETPRELAFCAHALDSPETIIVSDALADPRFANNALVTSDPNIRFYAGVPLVSPEGCVLGTLCVIDRVVRALGPADLRLLNRLARQVEAELELRRGLAELRSLCESRPTLRSPQLPHGVVNEEPARLLQEIQRVQREKDRLVELVVHDLKGPLMGVLINATMLAQASWADPRTREMASDIEMSATSMQRLVLDLLDIGRSKHGCLVARMGPIQLAPFLDDVLRMMRPRAVLKEQALVLELADDIELRGDRDLLRRLLENLIDNSLRYAPEYTQVTVHAQRLGSVLRLCVADTGPGIPAADRARIFEPFTRLGSGDAAAPLGHGLGLTFCRLAVDAHAGRIWVEPNDPKGARFCVELPCG